MASVVSNFNIKQVTNHDDLPYVGTYSVDVPYAIPDGNGNFIIETAKQNPNINFIGC